VYAQRVAGARPHVGDQTVEDVSGPIAERGTALGALVVEDAELDLVGGAAVHGDVGALGTQRDAGGVGQRAISISGHGAPALK